MFLVQSEVEVRLIPTYNSHAIQTFSITVYLFLALYGSTTSLSRLFLKNIKSSLYNQILVNNCSITSMHAKRKITICSHKHSFTLYPSLSPYSQTDRMTDGERIHSLRVGLRNFFSSCVCQFLVLAGNRFWFYLLMYLEYNTVVVLCQFLVLAGNSFWCYVRTQCTIQLCGCVSFLVVTGNSSQHENRFLQNILIGLLYYDPLADVCIS